MNPRSPVGDVAHVLDLARSRGAWAPNTRSAIFHDLDRIEHRVDELNQAFPPSALHTIAIKANPLVELLKVTVRAGCGLEAASWEEVQLALAAGCRPDRIVFDSPAKTSTELEQALELGVWLNVDNVDELGRLEALGAPRNAKIGLRVNPQVGLGKIAFTSTVGRHSRFGVPLEQAPSLKRRYPFITGLHVHTGSQGCGLELLAAAAQRVAAVAEELRMEWLDIGGGVPVRYTQEDPEPPTLDAWSSSLSGMPGWGTRPLITELGRAVHAGCGWALTRIEAVKSIDGAPMIVVHLGADFLLRRVYRATEWNHEMWILDPEGHPKQGSEMPTTIAGPLCFSGDLIARDRLLPEAKVGDLLLIRDCGAYTLSMWSRHCSRGLPPSWGYRTSRASRSGDTLVPLHHGESPTDVVEFWSLDGRKPSG